MIKTAGDSDRNYAPSSGFFVFVLLENHEY